MEDHEKLLLWYKCDRGGLAWVPPPPPPSSITHALSGLRGVAVSFLARLRVGAWTTEARQEEAKEMQSRDRPEPSRNEPRRAESCGVSVDAAEKRLLEVKRISSQAELSHAAFARARNF